MRQVKVGRHWITSPWLNLSDAVLYTGASEEGLRQAMVERRLEYRAVTEDVRIFHCDWLDDWMKEEAVEPTGERPGRVLSLARKPEADGRPPDGGS